MATSESLLNAMDQFVEAVFNDLGTSSENTEVSQLANTVQSSSENNVSGNSNAEMINGRVIEGDISPERDTRQSTPTRMPRPPLMASPITPPPRPRRVSTRGRRSRTILSPNVVIDLSEVQSPPLRTRQRQSLSDSSSLVNNSDVILVEPSAVIDLCTPKAQTPRRRHCSHSESSNHSIIRSKRTISMALNARPPNDAPQKKCPICLEAVHHPTATTCGHIFCQECISQAIILNHKCPMCKTKIDKRGLRRIYL